MKHNPFGCLSTLPAVFFLCLMASGCHEKDETDENKLDPYVDTQAHPILIKEGSLHLFSLTTFFEDPANIDNDVMVLELNNFTPASTDKEPDEDKNEDKTLNDLGWTLNSWDEDTLAWLTTSSPKTADIYKKTRPYRILGKTGLSAAVTALNQPVYEAIDRNVYERQLAAILVWDFGNYTDESGEDVGRKKIQDHELFYGFELLPKASIWAEDLRFSSGATIYGATRSVAEEALVVEAVDDNGIFSLSKTRFGSGIADIKTALDAYPPGGERLEYRYTVDYGSFRKIYLNFDTSSDTAYAYTSQTGTVSFAVPYSIHNNPDYIEIDTHSLAKDERIILGNLPAYFNPIIAGPYTENGSASDNIADKAYYYGKRYIKTNATNRLLLEPVFFFDATAKNDIQNAFKLWRQERHLEEDT